MAENEVREAEEKRNVAAYDDHLEEIVRNAIDPLRSFSTLLGLYDGTHSEPNEGHPHHYSLVLEALVDNLDHKVGTVLNRISQDLGEIRFEHRPITGEILRARLDPPFTGTGLPKAN